MSGIATRNNAAFGIEHWKSGSARTGAELNRRESGNSSHGVNYRD